MGKTALVAAAEDVRRLAGRLGDQLQYALGAAYDSARFLNEALHRAREDAAALAAQLREAYAELQAEREKRDMAEAQAREAWDQLRRLRETLQNGEGVPHGGPAA